MSDEICQPRRAQARRSVDFEYWRSVTVRLGHLATSSLAPRPTPLV